MKQWSEGISIMALGVSSRTRDSSAWRLVSPLRASSGSIAIRASAPVSASSLRQTSRLYRAFYLTLAALMAKSG